ncbi:MAG: tagatose 1,6-diphosphate aldolase [Dehalococcoidales bacterium]|nr:MAG: tagatose 1,6-diphosphate aldolase [Dehalococcoidales bacterium]
MKSLTTGKIRGLMQIANNDGILAMCAMDHRGSLRSMIDEDCPGEVDYDEMVERKVELCSVLAEYASAILLDPVFGAAQCISHGVLPRSTGLLVSIEASGYRNEEEGRLTELLNGWSVVKIKRMGASAVKILVYYRPDLPELAAKQLGTVNAVASECITADIPFLVEPLYYPLGDEINDPQGSAGLREQMVIQMAREITALPMEILKAEFPSDLRFKKDEGELIEVCRWLDNASRVPWVILSAGVDFEVFYHQAEIACRGGASGFLGGRAIWQEAMFIEDKRERMRYLSTVGVDRMKKLTEVASKYAVPWYKKMGLNMDRLADVPEGWYQDY